MKLTKDELLEYAKKSLENANELIVEGNLLLENNKFARAFTLFQLSTEETGAALLIIESILFDTYKKRKQQNALWNQIRNHKIKIKSSQRADLLLAKTITDEKIQKTLLNNYIKQSEEIDNINNYKKYSLYVSIIDKKTVKPTEKFNKKIVDDFKFYAEIRHATTKQFIEALESNLDEVVKKIKEIDSNDFINNPPQEIKKLISLIETPNR